MLLNQHYGRPFITEVPVESLEEIPILPPVTNLAEACVALVSETGLVPLGNPDGFKSHRNTVWKKYSIASLNSMQDDKWELRHAGWDVSFNTKNPNYAAPLDVCREMEREGVFARLYPALYSVCGNNGQISVMQRIGREMAADMKADGVDVALLVAT
jgi:glycine reductase